MAVMNTVLWVICRALIFGGPLLQLTFGQTAQVSIVGVPVVTVCEALHDLSNYNGKSIVVFGRFGYTGEGTWLSEDCPQKTVTDGYTWADIISTTYAVSDLVEPPPSLPKDFKWDRELLLKKLKEVQKTTKLRVLKDYNYTDKWVAIFGRFETRIPLIAIGREGRGQMMGYGFGHLNAAPAQLIPSKLGFHELKVN